MPSPSNKINHSKKQNLENFNQKESRIKKESNHKTFPKSARNEIVTDALLQGIIYHLRKVDYAEIM